MIKIRLWGLPEEVEQARFALEESFKINYATAIFKDRGESEYVRQYVEAEVYAEKVQTKTTGKTNGL